MEDDPKEEAFVRSVLNDNACEEVGQDANEKELEQPAYDQTSNDQVHKRKREGYENHTGLEFPPDESGSQTVSDAANKVNAN